MRFLLLGTVFEHQQQADIIADHRVLILQIIVQAQALCGQVLTDNRHAQVATPATTVLGREGIVEDARLNRQLLGLVQQRFPLLVRQALALPIRPRVLAAMVEETDIVVHLLQRLDFILDKLVHLLEKGG